MVGPAGRIRFPVGCVCCRNRGDLIVDGNLVLRAEHLAEVLESVDRCPEHTEELLALLLLGKGRRINQLLCAGRDLFQECRQLVRSVFSPGVVVLLPPGVVDE